MVATIALLILASHVLSPVQNCFDDAAPVARYRQSDDVGLPNRPLDHGDDLRIACESVLKTREADGDRVRVQARGRWPPWTGCDYRVACADRRRGLKELATWWSRS